LHSAYLIAAIVITLSVLEGHSSIPSLLKCDISKMWRVARSLCICRASSSSTHGRFTPPTRRYCSLYEIGRVGGGRCESGINLHQYW